MSLFDMFSQPAPQPAVPAAANLAQPVTPAPTPVQPGNLPQGSGVPVTPVVGAEPDGITPAPATPAEPVSPMGEFEKLWEPVATPEGGPAAPQKLDAAKLQEIVSKATLTNSIPAETLTAITAGGEGAQEALLVALNSVAQTTLMQATLASNKITEQAVATAIAAQQAGIPELIRTQSAAAQLRTDNPLYSNPAVTPVIQAVEQQLAAKNPDATPQELTTMAKSFVSAMAESFAPIPASDPLSAASAQDTDWNKFLAGS